MKIAQTVGGYQSRPLKIFAIRRVKVYLREQCILYLNHPSKWLNSGFYPNPAPSLLKFSKSNCQTNPVRDDLSRSWLQPLKTLMTVEQIPLCSNFTRQA